MPKTPDDLEGRKPQVWDAQENRDWLYAMPYKANMRHMWIDCNRLVSAGRGDKKTEFAEIYTASRDIAQRSGNYASLWEETATRYQELMECEEDLRSDDWIIFDVNVQIAWNTCNTCHLSAWSPHYLHVTEGAINAWTSDKLTPHEGNIQIKTPPPEIQNRRSMKALLDAFALIDECNLKKDPKYVDQMLEGCKTIFQIASSRATYWRAIQKSALEMTLYSDASVDLDEGELDLEMYASLELDPDELYGKDIDKVREAYGKMITQCKACHATQAGGEREVMTPLSWNK